MAYCVHCGVKLGESEKKCPLCGTGVYDPAARRDTSAPRPYPVHTPEQVLKKNKDFLQLLAGLLLLAPAALCLVIDLLVSGTVTWSAYAACALALLYVAVTVPLQITRKRVYWNLAVSFLCLNAYLFLAERFSESGPWFFPIALPAISLGTALLAALIILYRVHRLNKLTLPAASLMAVGLECLAIEWLCTLQSSSAMGFTWSPFVLAPCLFIALCLFFINGNRAVREEVRRRVHF